MPDDDYRCRVAVRTRVSNCKLAGRQRDTWWTVAHKGVFALKPELKRLACPEQSSLEEAFGLKGGGEKQ